MLEVKAKSKTNAVIKAITDEIKAMAGKMEFTATADELRHKDKRLG